MGNNVVKVKNLSGKKVICLSFNNSDIIYWSYREMIRPPVDGKEAELDGLQGGGAVKVAVVYDVDPTTNRFIYDLFQVAHGETLTIREFDDARGVTACDGNIKAMSVGRSIEAKSDHKEGVKSAINTAFTIGGIAAHAHPISSAVATSVNLIQAARNKK